MYPLNLIIKMDNTFIIYSSHSNGNYLLNYLVFHLIHLELHFAQGTLYFTFHKLTPCIKSQLCFANLLTELFSILVKDHIIIIENHG